MADTFDMDNATCRTYDVLVNAANVGWVDDLEFTVTLTTKERIVKQLHGQVMGHRLLGVAARAKMTLREMTPANLAKAFPWSDGSSPIPLMPTGLGQDLYQYAVPVTLHPRDVSGAAEDITLLKGVCISGFTLKPDGENEDGNPVEFVFYPDRAQLPNLVLGTLGAA